MKTKIVTLTILNLLLLCGMRASSQSNTYTGQQLFQGVFFGVGPVAQLVPELYSSILPTNQSTPNVSLLVSNLTAQAAIQNSNGYPANASKLLRLAQRVSNVPSNTPPSNSGIVQSNVMNQIALSDPSFFTRFSTNMQSGNAVLVSAAVKEGTERLWQQVDTMSDSEFAADVGIILDAAVAVEVYAVLIAVWAAFAFYPLVAPGASNYSFDDKISLLTARLNHNGPQPIPTVSEWGMIILILAILAFGIYAIVKRQAKLKP